MTFSSLATSWIIDLEIYDYEKSYEAMKPFSSMVYFSHIFRAVLKKIKNHGEG